MQRMFPTRSNERITSWDSLNRYFAALSSSLGRVQSSARAVSPPNGESVVVDSTGSAAVTSDFITSQLTVPANRFLVRRLCAPDRNLTSLRYCATFVSSLERGVIRSPLRNTEKSFDR